MARLYQRLGYVGRCSFDVLLVGERVEDSRVEFVECNGRWGGASLPMTLMNRLFGNWRKQPYAAREVVVEGLDRFSFADLRRHFADQLWDARDRGKPLILYNPGRIQVHAGINVLALGRSWNEAQQIVQDKFPERLREFVTRGENAPM
jgi:hypothetical protein